MLITIIITITITITIVHYYSLQDAYNTDA